MSNRVTKDALVRGQVAFNPNVFVETGAAAKFLNVSKFAPVNSFSLSAGVPRHGKSYLRFYSAVATGADPANDYSYFSSEFQGALSPQVRVIFEPIHKDQPHVVEFSISLVEPFVPCHFQVSGLNSGQQEVTVSEHDQTLPFLVPVAPNLGHYDVGLVQLNAAADSAAWVFHSVRVTAAKLG